MTKKKRTRKNHLSKDKSQPNLVVRLIRSLIVSVITLLCLTIVLVGSIWVAGPRLFALDNYKNILFFSSEIDSDKGKTIIAYFFPDSQEVKVISVKSTEVSVLGGYGEYELDRLYPLLAMERKKAPYQKAAYSWGTQTVIDHLHRTNSNDELNNKKQLLKQLKIAAFNNIINPREFVELAKAFFFTRSIPTEQIIFSEEEVAADKLDILNNLVLYEDCTVAVVNTTEKLGLASKLSGVIEQNGVVVVRVTDQDSPYQLSTFSFSADHGSCLSLSERLEVLFPNKLIKQQNQQLQQEYRADLVIFIGKDMADLL